MSHSPAEAREWRFMISSFDPEIDEVVSRLERRKDSFNRDALFDPWSGQKYSPAMDHKTRMEVQRWIENENYQFYMACTGVGHHHGLDWTTLK